MGEKEETKSIYVVSFQLNIEKWQADILDKRFSILTIVYKNLQRKYVNKFNYISKRKDYIEASKTFKGKREFFMQYTEPWIKIKKGERVESTYKPFTEFGINAYSSKFLDNVSNSGINSAILSSVARSAWKAWDKMFYGNGKRISYHDKEVNSYKICSVKNNGKTYFIGFDYSKIATEHIIGIKTNNRNGKMERMMYIPFIVNKKSIYETICFNDELKEIGLKRRLIRGKYKYYIFFSFSGKPYNKGRELGEGKVGIDLGPSTIAAVSNSNVYIDELAKGIEKYEARVSRLMRKLDRSRRANNPLQYNEDGTIKRYKKGERPLWVKSNNYIKIKNEIAEIMRKISEKRKLKHIIMANEISKFGSEFNVENNPVSSWSKKAKETTVNNKGKFKSKKRFGKSVMNHAPSEFIEILKNKVVSSGGKFSKVEISNGASQFDFTNKTFSKHNLGTRRIELSNGNVHLRDTLAAFNIMHCLDAGKKDENAFDVNGMKKDYAKFVELERNEIERHKNNDKYILKSFGIK